MTHAKTDYRSKDLWTKVYFPSGAIILMRAYLVMLALGIIHLQWTAAIPPLSFLECLALSTAFAFIKR